MSRKPFIEQILFGIFCNRGIVVPCSKNAVARITKQPANVVGFMAMIYHKFNHSITNCTCRALGVQKSVIVLPRHPVITLKHIISQLDLVFWSQAVGFIVFISTRFTITRHSILAVIAKGKILGRFSNTTSATLLFWQFLISVAPLQSFLVTQSLGLTVRSAIRVTRSGAPTAFTLRSDSIFIPSSVFSGWVKFGNWLCSFTSSARLLYNKNGHSVHSSNVNSLARLVRCFRHRSSRSHLNIGGYL